MKDRKRRIRINTEVSVNGRKTAEALDLSESGMYVFTSHTFIPGVEVSLEFDLEGNRYDIRASLKHVEEGVGFGVMFVDIDDDIARRLRAYVDSH